MKRVPRIVPIGIVLVVVAGLGYAGWTWWAAGRNGADRIAASGRIEVTEVNVSSKVTGRLTMLTDEGTDVKQGQAIALLEGDDLQAQLRQARATQRSAEAKLAQARIALRVEPTTAQSQVRQAEETLRASDERLRLLQAGSRVQEIEEGRANARQAEARMDIARITRDRYQGLAADGAIAQHDFDRTESDLVAAEAALRATRERLGIIEEGARAEEIRAGRAERDRASAALESARAGLSSIDLRAQDVRVAEAALGEAQANVNRLEVLAAELRVFAPMDATVLTKATEIGEVVAAGKPLLLLGDLDHPWIKVYVPETALGKFRLGTPARIYVDSFPGQPFQGAVSWIADQAEFTPKNVQTAEERVNLVYAVKIMIPNAQRKLKSGMPADAEILLGPAAK
jgi:HlyD family secretion protein